jgi:ABC-type multidrug transport system fused ATPase/permease subunit
MNALQRYLLKGIIQFSADIVFLILCLLVLFAFSIALGTIVFFSFLLLTIAMRIAANASKAHLEQKRKAKAGLFHFVSRRLSQYYSLLTFNMNEREIKKFEERNLKYYKFTEPYFRLSALYQALVPVSYFLIFMVVLMYTSIAEVKEAYQREGYASILSFMLILLYSQSVMKRIQRINPIWHQGKMAIARFKSIPDTRNEITENVEQKLSSIELKVENLALPLLANQKLNFVCQPNTLSQLLYGDARVLRNFINVLLRTEDALSGKIRLNDMDADAMSSLNWRRNIGLGDSDIPFTGKDYFHSISYSSSDKKKKKASELIQTLIPGVNEEDFLNSKITHDGQDLSQEVKSQLAFLRAWMTEKKLIMLVEPFKGLTHEQLSLFIEFIEQKRKSYTILIACNELPFALKADQIISL